MGRADQYSLLQKSTGTVPSTGPADLRSDFRRLGKAVSARRARFMRMAAS